MSEMNYDNWWFHGQSAAYDFQGYFLREHQINHIMDRLTFPYGSKMLGWGISDLALMKHALNHLDQAKEPFFWIIQSQTNHTSYVAPDEFKVKTKYPESMKKFHSTVKYTDHSLGYFLDHFFQTEQGKNSLVIITADHGTGIGLADYKKGTKNRTLLKYRIPLLFLYPQEQSIEKKIVTTLGSQSDVYPTLLDVLNIKSDHPIFGRSLMRNYSERFAKAIVEGNWLMNNNIMYYIKPKNIAVDSLGHIVNGSKKWYSLAKEIDDIQDWVIQQKDMKQASKQLVENGWNKF